MGANVVNIAVEILFVYGFDGGIRRSAWGTVTAQVTAAPAYVYIALRIARANRASPRPRAIGIRTVAVIGGPLIVRTASLLAVSLTVTALAAQAMVGRFLGAGDAPDARGQRAHDRARHRGRRGDRGGRAAPLFPSVFSDDGSVRHLATEVLRVVAVLQPLAAVVFAPLAVAISAAGGGLLASWGAIAAWMVARAVGVVSRFLGPRWAVVGASRRWGRRPGHRAKIGPCLFTWKFSTTSPSSPSMTRSAATP